MGHGRSGRGLVLTESGQLRAGRLSARHGHAGVCGAEEGSHVAVVSGFLPAPWPFRSGFSAGTFSVATSRSLESPAVR